MDNTLNQMQQKIVEHTEGPVMVLAGAGSGKTRVLTHRIAHILQSGLAGHTEILAITFTNKAANEIKQRLYAMGLLQVPVWVMTFHSMCCKILRAEAHNLDGYNSNFSIYDEQDKKNIIKKIIKEQEIKDDDIASDVYEKLSTYKMSNMTLDEYRKYACFSPNDELIFSVMQSYVERLKQDNAMDFDDLINNTLFLLKNVSAVREKYQKQFRYILVDEFQDTNQTQYELVKILGAYHQNVFAVGDEDQSIYGWRGASVDNIKRFLNDFPSSTLYKLEQNYRSTKTIIDYANKIIKNNQNRIDKTLFTENECGATVVYNKCGTDREEAEFVAQTILGLVGSKGYKFSDIAVLLRLNALTRNFEEKFVNYNIPYKVFGGVKFFERAEIKNVLAYLRLIVNRQDEESSYRIINFPKRGIGDGAIKQLKQASFGLNLIDAVNMLDENVTGSLAKFLPFKKLMNDFVQKSQELDLYDFVCYVVQNARILEEYSSDTDEDYNRKLNIGEFLQNVKNYQEENQGKTLVDFLQTISLSTDIDGYQEDDNNVSLATVHSVKGLEFKVVFVVGLEERYFPIVRQDDDSDIEEERRLMYVAITRAKERLYLTCSRSRFMYGKQSYSVVSRFVKELGYENSPMPNQYASNSFEQTKHHQTNFGGSLNNFMHQSIQKQSKENFVVGDRVFHPKFGVGYVVYINLQTKTINIDFDNFGNKALSLDFAPIKKL